ncbi:MAG TPA: HAMP domain-containing sensor histidine kinase [Acidimicrobiia bacterium]
MRRRLVLLSLATTVLVVIAFVVPLALLVLRQATDSAMSRAEQDAQTVAGLVALAAGSAGDPAAVAEAIGDLPTGTIVVLDDGTVFGEPRPGQGSLVASSAETRSTVSGDVTGGWEVALPVVGPSGVAIVDSFVSDAELTAGVVDAWLLLAGLALVLIGVAVWVADRLGRRLTVPIEELARSAHRLAGGDLDTRVTPGDTDELRETGEAFNYLAERLEALLAEERESAADLSHRLRTPMTSLRLEAESLGDAGDREAMLTQVDRLEHAMNQLIELSRSRAGRVRGASELNSAVSARVSFWSVLAEEQGRELATALSAVPIDVPLATDEVEVVVDTLIGNVFAHTPSSTSFQVGTGVDAGGVGWLEVADRGPGFGDNRTPERGVSGRGSTGLGLDIVRKAAESVGGSLEIDDRPGGGAVVRIRFG